MFNLQTIGILGGSGPVAGTNLLSEILSVAQSDHGATQDTDYPPVILYSLPLAGFSETGISDYGLVKKHFLHGLQVLRGAGCDLIIIACQTLHTYLPELPVNLRSPILDMVTLTIDQIKQTKSESVGILASETTNTSGLYSHRLSNLGIQPIILDRHDQISLNQIILHVMGGSQTQTDIDTLQTLIHSLILKGADSIVIGCTELSVITTDLMAPVNLYDGVKIVAQAALQRIYR